MHHPILVYFSGDSDVHWGYGLLTHGHFLLNVGCAGCAVASFLHTALGCCTLFLVLLCMCDVRIVGWLAGCLVGSSSYLFGLVPLQPRKPT